MSISDELALELRLEAARVHVSVSRLAAMLLEEASVCRATAGASSSGGAVHGDTNPVADDSPPGEPARSEEGGVVARLMEGRA